MKNVSHLILKEFVSAIKRTHHIRDTFYEYALLWHSFADGIIGHFGKCSTVATGMVMFLNLLNILIFAYEITATYSLADDLSIALFFSAMLFLSWLSPTILFMTAQVAQKQLNSDLQEAMAVVKNMHYYQEIVQRDAQRMMLNFFSRAIRFAPTVNFNGYLQLNSKTYTSLCTSILLNLIVLFQLNLKQKKISDNDFFDISKLFKLERI
ncbi:Hypothetical predicted protein [Cloeon dipterum]|uniref:Uncharacterized protein n=1 Tax=Cloeon dipterum TaxID=197152 RepID=A0A8S1BUL9_9INSE|nr:Hypothetical predicted protein [Cloeon dipterum]